MYVHYVNYLIYLSSFHPLFIFLYFMILFIDVFQKFGCHMQIIYFRQVIFYEGIEILYFEVVYVKTYISIFTFDNCNF